MSLFREHPTNWSLLHDVAMTTWTPHAEGEYLVSLLVICFSFLVCLLILNLSIFNFFPAFLVPLLPRSLKSYQASPTLFNYDPSTFAMAEVDKMNRIHGVEAIIGYRFTESSMIWEALQAAGSPVQVIGNRRIVGGNKRLAVLGDCVLDLALAEAWHEGTGPRGKNYTSWSDI